MEPITIDTTGGGLSVLADGTKAYWDIDDGNTVIVWPDGRKQIVRLHDPAPEILDQFDAAKKRREATPAEQTEWEAAMACTK